MEELIEEIRRRLMQLPTLLLLGQVATREGKELLSDAFIHSLITCVGQALIETGELNEMLGVVGRGEFVRDSLGLITASWNKPPTEPLSTKAPWHRFIAFSPKDPKEYPLEEKE